MHALTDYERQFADQHHDIVYDFLKSKGLSIFDYYDVIIFRYLRSVQRYLLEPELQRYSFKTIAYSAMRSALGHHFSAERRKQENCTTNTSLIESLVGYAPEQSQSGASKMLWLKVAPMLTEAEVDLVNKRAHGWTHREIAEEAGQKESTISSRMSNLRKRLNNKCDFDVLVAQISIKS